MMGTAETFTGEAHVATARAARYLEQMCKHFGHKIPVTRGEGTGTIAFDGGTCALAAAADGLWLEVSAADAETLLRLQDVVARHLQRFAFREDPAVVWTRKP